MGHYSFSKDLEFGNIGEEIVAKYFKELPEYLNDDDIIDAAGIGLWYCNQIVEGSNGKRNI